MIPAGYLLKCTDRRPGWLGAEQVVRVCSVADCANENLADVQAVWRHNGLGVANSSDVLREVAGSDVEGELYYYEAYEHELESDGWTFDLGAWRPLTMTPSAPEPLAPEPPPQDRELLGYDAVVFGDFLEHSPLSCNGIAETAAVNANCLFDTLDQAIAAIEGGVFGGGCEEGVYRIYSVSRIVSR